ncbi:MAG TPA: cupredoxin domain-containing protein [Mycobacteriales bacterium]|nr:cupredoxin domain-containing protein [Mycobacteriales bacterium]
MRRVDRLLPALALPAVALLVAACGGSSTQPAATSSGSAPGSGSTPGTSASASGTSPSGSAGGTTVEVEIEGFQFKVPASVPPGATVKVRNADGPEHSITAAKDKSLFDLDVAGGSTGTFTAPTTPGSYALICTYHPNMHGTLVVK